MADDKPHLSRVAPIVEPDDSEVARFERIAERIAERTIEHATPSIMSRWLRGWVGVFGKRVALLIVGSLGGGGAVYSLQDAPVERPAPASGPNPEPPKASMPDAPTAEACVQSREDARLTLDFCARQAEACGVAPETLPRADPPPQRYVNTP